MHFIIKSQFNKLYLFKLKTFIYNAVFGWKEWIGMTKNKCKQ